MGAKARWGGAGSARRGSVRLCVRNPTRRRRPPKPGPPRHACQPGATNWVRLRPSCACRGAGFKGLGEALNAQIEAQYSKRVPGSLPRWLVPLLRLGCRRSLCCGRRLQGRQHDCPLVPLGPLQVGLVPHLAQLCNFWNSRRHFVRNSTAHAPAEAASRRAQHGQHPLQAGAQQRSAAAVRCGAAPASWPMR